MRLPRLYLPEFPTNPYRNDGWLQGHHHHYLAHVLRMKAQAQFIFFNGQYAFEYLAKITHIYKRLLYFKIVDFYPVDAESPVKTHLGQAVAKGDKFDFVLQKATELGINAITPVLTARTEFKLPSERLAKKQRHWQNIVNQATQQCGRVFPPVIHPLTGLQDWLSSPSFNDSTGFAILPDAVTSLSELVNSVSYRMHMLVGPEGGFNDHETEMITQYMKSAKLGPRIMRTETAPLAALATIQSSVGDL